MPRTLAQKAAKAEHLRLAAKLSLARAGRHRSHARGIATELFAPSERRMSTSSRSAYASVHVSMPEHRLHRPGASRRCSNGRKAPHVSCGSVRFLRTKSPCWSCNGWACGRKRAKPTSLIQRRWKWVLPLRETQDFRDRYQLLKPRALARTSTRVVKLWESGTTKEAKRVQLMGANGAEPR